MLNFTVGPVMLRDTVLEIGGEQIPYFRTPEFSELMLENERYIIQFSKAGENARAIFLTGSGTAAMEAAVINSFSMHDKVLVVNGGSFGQRFVKLCKIHHIPFTEIHLEYGKTLQRQQLMPYDGKEYTGFIVNLHETSTGVLYDLNMISEFCEKNNLYLVVDAISSFLADTIDMEHSGIDIMLTGSQKALACPPGISIVVMSERAVERVSHKDVQSLYFNLKDALKDGERGQTCYTPAVGILRQINVRLKEIYTSGGVDAEIERIKYIANDFRKKIKGLPFEIISDKLSNAVTPLHPTTISAQKLFTILKDEYHIWICPNGGKLADSLFRVGHIGSLTMEDNTILVNAFLDMKEKGKI